MIHFLVDYENVNYKGLDGVEYLEPDDRMTIFYSDCCNKMEEYKIRSIWESGCKLDIVKLVKKRKNGLDFYIASKVGEILSNDDEVNVAIVSEDNGLKAVLDYWNERINPSNRLIINDTIANCIVSSAESVKRKKPIQAAFEKINLEEVMKIWNETQTLEFDIYKAFMETEYADIIPEIIDVVRSSNKKKGLYLNSVKAFGKKSGLEIYSKIKYGKLYHAQSA